MIERRGQEKARVLMLVPYRSQQRGNVLTAERIFQGLSGRGWSMQRLFLEDDHGMEELQAGMAVRKYQMIHGFHALHVARALHAEPRLRDIPLLLTTTGTDIHYGLSGPESRQVLSALHMSRFIVIFNPHFEALIEKYYPGVAEKLVVIPQGVWLPSSEPTSRENLGLEKEHMVFLLPSGLRSVKNIELALEGLSLLRKTHPRMSLLILGAVLDEDYGNRILNRIRELDWVRYLGEVAHNQVKSVYALADVVINCSLAEGQPQAALEAMSLGKPALLSSVPGNQGIMEDGIQGFYFRSAPELAIKAGLLADSLERRRMMGQAAILLVREKYELERELQAYESLYKVWGHTFP
ncbi:MAG TPA: glycosyltransferase [Syntrophomonadaceae bacterium]|nr:glycosyltransferase [Syntrophomonadaceae bacterium]